MEADLHAIVRDILSRLVPATNRIIDPLWAALVGCSLPVLHLPNVMWSEVYPLGERASP